MGRPRERTDKPTYLALPKKESEQARKMKATYLMLPANERSDGKLAKMFGVSRQTVMRYRLAFDWEIEGSKQEKQVFDAFLEKHKHEITRKWEEWFYMVSELIRQEFEKQGLTWNGENVMAAKHLSEIGDPNGALEKLKGKDLSGDYKNLNHLFDLFSKVLHSRSPEQKEQKKGPLVGSIGDNAKILIKYD